jgi:hypothetical protein
LVAAAASTTVSLAHRSYTTTGRRCLTLQRLAVSPSVSSSSSSSSVTRHHAAVTERACQWQAAASPPAALSRPAIDAVTALFTKPPGQRQLLLLERRWQVARSARRR